MAKSLSFDIKSFSDNKQNLFLQNVVSFGEKGRFSGSKTPFCSYDIQTAANRAQMIPMFTLTEYHFFTVAKGTA
jgi:hypothetical protein